jgi:hypothetical protein
MNDEQHRVLQMVQQGQITAEEADRLLAALESATPRAPASAQPASPETAPAADQQPRRRRYWEIPVAIGLVLLGISGLCLNSMSITLAVLCGWSLVVVGLLITVLGLMSGSMPWVHVRIRPQTGRRIVLSLPTPLGLIAPLIRLAGPLTQRFGGDDARENLDMAAMLITMLRETSLDEPMWIEIEDDDGDHIEVYWG